MASEKAVYYLFLLAGVAAASFSQVLLKKGSMGKYASFLQEYLNPWVMGGYLLLLLCTVLNLCGLRGLPYLSGPVIESFGYILVLFLGRLVFKERITGRKLAGVGCILAGILVYYL